MATKKKKSKASKRKPARRSGRGRRFLMLALLLLLLGGGAAAVFMLKGPQPEVAVAASVAQTAGSKGAGNGNLDSPRGLGVAPDGSVYVADLSNGRIAVFGPDGAFKRNFGKLGPEPGKGKPGEFNEPSGVAVGPDGTVYVADAWNGRIQKLSPDGKPLGEYGGARYSFYSPRNVAVDRNNNVYVADTGNSRVRVIDPNGKVIKDLGGRGSGGGQFNEVFGVAVNSRGGDFVKDVKVPGWQTASPFWPHVAVDAQDNVYAVDPGNRKIWAYDSDLKYLGTLGGPAGELFAGPLGLGFAPDGHLWVSDQANNRLLKLAPFDLPAAAK
jgi:DNA-binding beta-propeller fold protein YncE